LRAMPNLTLWRPCDATETAVAWIVAIEHRDGPTALVLTRQNLPQQPRTEEQKANIARGGYVLIDGASSDSAADAFPRERPASAPEVIVIATGSEIGIAADAVRALNSRGRRVRLVSMPSTEAFERQDAAYRDSVLPPSVTKRLAVEAAATQSWWRYVGLRGRVLGIDRFGASGKATDLFPHFGFTADNVAKEIDML
jgi:transketolase